MIRIDTFTIGLLLSIIAITALLQLIEPKQFLLLHYDRELFWEQIYLQWITPSLVHVGWKHWFLNIINLTALVLLFPHVLKGWKLIKAFTLFSLFIMLCLYFFSTEITHYAGMSGVLYALAVWASLISFDSEKIASIIILLYVTAKLIAHDQINALMGVDIYLSDMTVVTDVHWYGALAGILYFLGEKFWYRYGELNHREKV